MQDAGWEKLQVFCSGARPESNLGAAPVLVRPFLFGALYIQFQ